MNDQRANNDPHTSTGEAEALDGKVAIVTGGGSGIGAAVCRDFARHGADVLIVGRRHDAAGRTRLDVTELGGAGAVVTGDVSDPQTCDTMIAAAIEKFGHLDILVNNAGTVSQTPIVDMSDDQWDDMLRVDLCGAFFGCRAAARVMIDQGQGGRIINTSSIMAWQTRAGQGAYAAAKAGVLAMSRALAIELGPHRITVNSVLPGHVQTRITDPMFTPEVERAFTARIPLGAVGRPGESGLAARGPAGRRLRRWR